MRVFLLMLVPHLPLAVCFFGVAMIAWSGASDGLSGSRSGAALRFYRAEWSGVGVHCSPFRCQPTCFVRLTDAKHLATHDFPLTRAGTKRSDVLKARVDFVAQLDIGS